MEFEKAFPLRLWINLGRRQDRRFEMELRMAEAGISAERFPAIDSRFVKRKHGYESKGRYALALSQRLALRKGRVEGAAATLIFEDDAVFHPRFLERIREIELPDDWGILYFGCAHMKRPVPVCSGLVRARYALDTHAFAVHSNYYTTVIEALNIRRSRDVSHARASDWFLADLHDIVPTYACFPNLAWQAVTRSDLAGVNYSNYTSSGEQVSGAGEMIGLQAEMWGARRWISNASHPERSRVGPTMEEPNQLKPNTERCIIGERGSSSVQLAILFLTRGDLNHPWVWEEFRKGSENEVHIFSHPKLREEVKSKLISRSIIEEYISTNWGDVSLIRAMLALLRSALLNPTITHFAFASESCVPIKSWAAIRRRLRLDPRSMMDFADGSKMEDKHFRRIAQVRDLPEKCYRLHSQWSLLNRDAAECISEIDFSNHFSSVFAADEHYFGSVLALRGFDDDREINRKSLTWVDWENGSERIRPRSFESVSVEVARRLAGFDGFFARKFEAGSDIGRWKLHLD